jgi:diguanylate cyclase (GGDEF)-like protein
VSAGLWEGLKKKLLRVTVFLGLPSSAAAAWSYGLAVLFILGALFVCAALGLLFSPSGSSGGFFVFWLVLGLGVPWVWAWVLGRGKPAPALRSSLAPMIIVVLSMLAVQRNGGAWSPFGFAYVSSLILVSWHSGRVMAVCLALVLILVECSASVCFGMPVWPNAVLAGLVPMTGIFLGFLMKVPGSLTPVALTNDANAQEVRIPTFPSPSQDLPSFNSLAWMDRMADGLMEMGFQAHPQWNSLLLMTFEPAIGAQPAFMQSWKSRSRGQEFKARFMQIEGEGIFGWVLKERKALCATSLPESSAAVLPHYHKPQGIKALCCVPYFSEGELWGALAFDKVQESSIHPEEQAFLEALGRHWVSLIHQARSAEQAKLQGEQFSRLHQASRRLSQDLDRETILGQLLELLKSLMPLNSMYLAMKREDQEFELVLQEGYTEDFSHRFSHLDFKTGLSGWVLAQSEAVVFSTQAEGQVPAFMAEGLKEALGSTMLVPLELAHGVTGLLKLDRHQGNEAGNFEERDREVAAIFASQLAVHLENARLYTLHKQLATTDGLTGLHNHRYFQERLALEIEKSSRTGEPLCMALLDIDFFKKFNDSFGHQEGDNVLKKVAKLLKQMARPGQDLPFRYGGEEFVMVLPRTNLPEAMERMELLRAASEQDLRGGNAEEQRPITFSIGVCAYPMGAKDQRQLIHLADESLYQAKHDGRNRVRCFKDLAGF